MKSRVTRREALKRLTVAAGSLVTVAAVRVNAASRPDVHLAPQDADAMALSYHENADNLSEKEYPEHKPGQRCGNCIQIGGNDGDTWRPCAVMSRKLVNVNGWCQAYFRKP